jgi:hypothetical protein
MKTFDNEWIVRGFEDHPSFFTKRMFGGLAVSTATWSTTRHIATLGRQRVSRHHGRGLTRMFGLSTV